jgi:toxin HigB-1
MLGGKNLSSERVSKLWWCVIILLVISRVPCYYVVVIHSFKDRGTEDIFNGKNTEAARRTCPQNLWKVAARKLDQLDSVQSLDELRLPPGNRLEALTGDRKGRFSIRLNDQYRICFVWAETEPDEVEVVDYH